MPDITVPIIRIPFDDEDRAFIHEGVDGVLASGMLSGGRSTAEFEAAFAAFTGARHAVAVSSGTAALELVLRALGIQDASVIVPTNTFLATALAAIHAGNRVIFADSDPETFALDPADVERRVAPDTRAIVLVHIGGIITPAYRDLLALCQRRGLALVEDCAHAHGSTIDGRHAGTLGVAGAFSFFPTKTLTTGEGGMVVTNDDALAREVAILRNQGKDPSQGNHIARPGHNFRMSEITAVLGLQQMKKAHAILADRDRIARFYDHALAEIPQVRPVTRPAGCTFSHYKYLAYLDEPFGRAAVKQVMRERYGVALPGEVYADLCHREPIWRAYTYCGRRRAEGARPVCHRWPACGCDAAQDGFPGATHISRRHLCLPMYPGLSDAELKHVVASLARTLQHDLAPAGQGASYSQKEQA